MVLVIPPQDVASEAWRITRSLALRRDVTVERLDDRDALRQQRHTWQEV